MEVKLFLFAVAYLALVLACIVVALVWSTRRKFGFFKTAGVVLATVFLLYAIPFGDHTVGYLYFRHLCDKEAGVKIQRTVPNVEGFWWWPIQDGEIALKYGYAFVEGGVDPQKGRRYEVLDATIVEYKDTTIKSRYAFRSSGIANLSMGIQRGGDEIVDLRTGEKLAEELGFQFRGGWMLRKVLSGSGGSSGYCPTNVDYLKLITTVLKPSQATK